MRKAQRGRRLGGWTPTVVPLKQMQNIRSVVQLWRSLYGYHRYRLVPSGRSPYASDSPITTSSLHLCTTPRRLWCRHNRVTTAIRPQIDYGNMTLDSSSHQQDMPLILRSRKPRYNSDSKNLRCLSRIEDDVKCYRGWNGYEVQDKEDLTRVVSLVA